MVANIRKQQGGFTLVEIAIVLVIIGLLLGGILKGQELITSARVRNIADQNSGVQAAYYGFIDRYRQVPGDMDKDRACQAIGTNLDGCTGGVGTHGGDGNGRLNQDDFTEAGAVWAHLSGAGFINGLYVGATDLATYNAVDGSPVNAFNGHIMLTSSDRYEGSTAGTPRILMFTGTQIPVNVMRELDVKVDDGIPNRGVMRSATGTAGGGNPWDSDTASCVDAANNIWNIDANSPDCGGSYLY
jgi:prepilin-type N-terminal cleavage/methylation domain-containing protein